MESISILVSPPNHIAECRTQPVNVIRRHHRRIVGEGDQHPAIQLFRVIAVKWRLQPPHERVREVRHPSHAADASRLRIREQAEPFHIPTRKPSSSITARSPKSSRLRPASSRPCILSRGPHDVEVRDIVPANVVGPASPTPGGHAAACPGSHSERALARRFAEALTTDDIDGVIALLTDDAWLAMPPAPHEYHGPAAIASFLRASALQPYRARASPRSALTLGTMLRRHDLS